MQAINAAMLDTLAACGDVNRNVLSASNPFLSKHHQQAYDLARAISEHLLPQTGAYHEVWLDGEKVEDKSRPAGAGEEPIYGVHYLPRKFKTVVAVPPSNDVDIFAQDLGYIAIVEDGEIAGLISAGSCRSQKLDFDAEIYAVYVASKYWRLRLGLRLMAAAAQRLALFGHKDVMLWSLEDNLEARAFYERLGGEEIGRMVEQMGGAELREIGYGWRKIDLLLRVCDELPFQ